MFVALKGTYFCIFFAVTAAGVVECPRTSTIVQFIFHFWSFEIKDCILRTQKLTIDLNSYSRQFIYLDPIWIYIHVYQSLNRLLIWNSQNCNMFSSCFRCKLITGSVVRIKYLKLRSMAHLLSASAFRKLPSIYVFSYFPFGFEGRMWDLIVSVPDHCLSFYFSLECVHCS